MSMTIDEMIAQYKEKAKYNKMRADFSGEESYCSEQKQLAEEHEQIAEWLEELRDARKHFKENRKAGYKHGQSDGYNKAIDEFAERLHDLCGFEIDDYQYPYLLHESRIDDIAEQLKAGGKDE